MGTKERNLIGLLTGIILGILVGFAVMSTEADAKESRQEVIQTILEVCADNWPKYHGYASTCAMMAAQESLFGKAGRPNNLWGLGGGRFSYPTLEDGIKAWLKCINNEFFPKAKCAKNGDEQLAYLLAHGYCEPVGNYYSACMWLKNYFHLDELDDAMFELIQEKKEKQDFRATYDHSIPYGCVGVDSDVVKGGTVRIGTRYYDVVAKEGLGSAVTFSDIDTIRSLGVFKIDEFYRRAVG